MPKSLGFPPPELARTGLFLGFDVESRWSPDGLPLRAEWWQNAVFGGHRHVGDVGLTEATAIMTAGPGAGKSAGWLAGVIALKDWPGPVVVVTTKTDLARWTAPLRQRLGAVRLLDWRGIQAATLPWPRVRWNPLVGCEDAGVCLDRVESMMETVELGRREEAAIWHGNAVSVLSAYFHAAALEGAGMARVMSWLRRDELEEPQRVIAAHGSRAGLGEDLAALAGKAEETKQGVLHTARPVVAALADPAVLDGVQPSPEDIFDIDRFVESTDTLFLLDKGGKSTVSKLAPLTVALVNAILERAEARADQTPAGPARLAGILEQPLLLVIDEVANISPLPNLTQVLSQARGRGIVVCVAAQSWSQLTERWGAAGAAAILDTAAFRLIGAGLQDMDFLTAISKSLGERQIWRPSVSSQKSDGPGGKGRSAESWSLTETPTIKASALAKLPEGSAVLIGREGWRVVRLPALPPLFAAMVTGGDPAPPARSLPDPAYGPEYRPETWGWPPPGPPWWLRVLRGAWQRGGHWGEGL
jgi:type IV secretion system protein VirD4